MTATVSRDQIEQQLLAELRELSRDVTGDPVLRARRLALVRRLEQLPRPSRHPHVRAIA